MRLAVQSLVLVGFVLVLTGCSGFAAGTDLQSEVRKHEIFLAPDGVGPFPAALMLHARRLGPARSG
jgi:hypothetical protein